MEKPLGRLLHSVPNGYGRTVVGGREIVTKPTVQPQENTQSLIDRLNNIVDEYSKSDSKYLEDKDFVELMNQTVEDDAKRDYPDLMQKARDFSTYIYDNPTDTVDDIVSRGYVDQSMLSDIGFDKGMTMRDYAEKQLNTIQDNAYNGIDLDDPRNKKLILELISESYTEY